MVLAVAAVLRRIGAVDIAGRTILGADQLGVGQIIHSGDAGTLRHDDDLYTGGIGLREVHIRLTLLVDGDARHSDVALAVLHSQHSGSKVHIVHHQFQAQFLSNEARNLYVNTLEAAVVGNHLIGREGGVGGHMQLSALHHQGVDVNIAAGSVLTVPGVLAGILRVVLAVGRIAAAAAAGSQGQRHRQGQNQRK